MLRNDPDGWEVDQPWLWWDGPAGGDGTGGPWGNPPPGADSFGPGSGGKSALPAMARCRSLIVDALAGVPWEVHRGREKLTTPDWILDPQGLREDGRVTSSVLDVRLSAVEFWSSFLVSALELGEGIAYTPNLDAKGAPLPPLFQLNPRDVQVEYGSYWVGSYRDEEHRIPPENILVVRNRVWPGKRRGVGVWDQFASEIGLGNDIRSYASGMLGRGIPAGYLKVSAPDLVEEEAEALKTRWMAAHGGSTRKIAVLNATTEFHPLQLDPKALQLVELMRLSAWEIALIYGIPPYKLAISMGYNNTYANIESASIDYVQDALLPWSRRIESAFDAVFPRGTSLKLNLDGLRRADTKTRFESYSIALTGGWMTTDEVRGLEDLPPLPATEAAETEERNLSAAEVSQKVYLPYREGLLTRDEARGMVNDAGGSLPETGEERAINGRHREKESEPR
jgi:HK97 family phage portal protein